MKKSLIFTAMLLSISVLSAQNNRADTTILGVYNTGARFSVTRADFGLQTATELIAEMVLVFDTVKVITTVADTSNRGRGKEKHSFEHRCNYLSGLQRTPDLFKDKIVLMELNKDCDVTQVCLLAQKSGAKAVMFIHNSNSNGNIKLPKNGLFKDSLRIPIFTVGKEKGEDISALLPSVVGIKTKVPPTAPQARVANDSTNTALFLAKEPVYTEGVGQNDLNAAINNLTNASIGIGKQGFFLSPNPKRNQTTVTYQFIQPTDVTVKVETETGQVVRSQILRGVTVGTFDLSTADYPVGTYFVTLQYGKEIKSKKLVVQH